MSQARPFSFRSAIVVDGGHAGAGRPWVAEVTDIAGKQYTKITATDRAFAMSMGMSPPKRSPWEDNGFLDKMMALRDDAVDVIISRYLRTLDPMADPSDELLQAASRPKAFADADVPEAIDVEVPAFITDTGERYGSKTISVVSTPKRRTSITIELTVENLAWIMAAIPQYEGAKKKAVDEHERIELQEHDCKWRKIGGTYKVACSWWCFTDNKRKVHSEKPAAVASQDLRTAIVRETELRVQKFHDENHDPHGAAAHQKEQEEEEE